MIVHPVQMQRTNICIRCTKQIDKGSPAVKVGMKQGARWVKWNYYHPDCFPQQLTEYCQEWYAKHPYRCKLGRKKKDSQPMMGFRYGKPVQTTKQKEARRLKALYRYYKKKGNKMEMTTINTRINCLCGSSPYNTTLSTLQNTKGHKDLTKAIYDSIMPAVSSLTERDATQVKGGCRASDELAADVQMHEANCSAVQP